LEILEKVNTFAYLGCKISYEEKKTTASKIRNFYKNFWNSEECFEADDLNGKYTIF